jgi:hypothetical protein
LHPPGRAERPHFDYDPRDESPRWRAAGDEARMFHPLIRSLVKVAVASLIVGTILAHFGITPEKLIKEFGLSYERIEELARRGLSWAGPNLLLGAMVILPVWFLFYLFRPPGSSQNQD